MAKYLLSADAEVDLNEIADYTIETFGIAQARKYSKGLFAAFGRIAAFPSMGSPCDGIRIGAWRFEHRSHVIFHRHTEDGVYILRILGADQDPYRHL